MKHIRTRRRSRRHLRLFLGFVIIASVLSVQPAQATPACAGPITASSSAASSEFNTTTWGTAKAFDGLTTTSWSSALHTSGVNNSEYLAWWLSGGDQTVTHIKLRPRWEGGISKMFPVTFTVYTASTTAGWTVQKTFTNLQVPTTDEWVTLVLPTPVTANAVEVFADVLGRDNYNNYAFDLAEAQAGCDTSLQSHWRYIGNDPGVSTVTVFGAGSDDFNPAYVSNWNDDVMSPYISAPIRTGYPSSQRNLYAPSVVWDSTNSRWNIYFGGWDGTNESTPHDRIKMVTTTDFITYTDHTTEPQSYKVLEGASTGNYINSNNANVIKQNNGSWRMLFTVGNQTGKIDYSESSDGSTWTPNTGTASNLITLTNPLAYPDWTASNPNGDNALYQDPAGTYHLYTRDLNTAAQGNTVCADGNTCILHFTSTDGKAFTYQGVVLNQAGCLTPQDMKHFTANSQDWYVLGIQCNTNQTWLSMGQSLTSLGWRSVDNQVHGAVPIFNTPASGFHTTTSGWVAKGNRLYGELYGGSAIAGTPLDLSQEAIYAKWLQKKVTFASDTGGINYATNTGWGPDRVILSTGGAATLRSGQITIKKPDATTVEQTSPSITLRPGDYWQYIP